MNKTDWRPENTVVCIDVKNRSQYPANEQLGHNIIVEGLRSNTLKSISATSHSFSNDGLIPIRNESKNYLSSFKLTTAQYFSTTIRKHHKCVQMAVKSKDMTKAMHHIDQCIKLAPHNAKFLIERSEIYIKLSDYQHAISDLHLAISLGSKSLDTLSINRGLANADSESPSIMSASLNRTEYENAVLMTGHLHIVHGENLKYQRKLEEALKQYELGRSFIDQYAQIKDLITNSSITPGTLVTLMGVLQVYESMERNDDYVNLITKCINDLENENLEIPEEILMGNPILTSRLYVPQLSDLLYARANLLSKQHGQSIIQAYYDLKKALRNCPNHLESYNLLHQLEIISSNKQEEAIELMLKNRFFDSLHSITIAIYAQPENISLYFDKGAILRKLDRLTESLDCIMHGINLFNTWNDTDKKNSADLYQLGRNQLFLTINSYAIKLLKQEKYQESNELIRQLLKVDPKNYRLLILSGDCQYFMRNYEKSLKEYENAKSIISKLLTDSNHCICNNNMMKIPESINSINGRICLTCYQLSKNRIKQSDWSNAINYLDRCICLAPFQSEFYMTRALVHYQSNHTKHSWNDILIFIYLNLSDWALFQRTNGKWSIYPMWYQTIVHNRFLSQVNEQIGPLIHRLTPKYIDLVKVANSKECELSLLRNLRRIINENKCATCQRASHSSTTKITFPTNGNQQTLENPIDWLHNRVSFNLFSEPRDDCVAKMPFINSNDITQKTFTDVCEYEYKQINAKIKEIRQRNFPRQFMHTK
ncbi:unnamed protein product [Schistosoma rodhaini]|uniref:Uncharacterized protein n=2 Tax=Schistosoma rodhaini TaxID=6188 RepID=A0AA85FU06_9TREM|nr:unnamed protein product [Schistosoma rodhaini]